MCRRNLKELCDCKVIVNECVAKQHRMVVCKMQNGEKEKSRKSKAKDNMVETKGDKLSRSIRKEVTRILGGKDGLPDKWEKTAEILRKTAETVLGVIFRKRKGDRETWWRNEKVQESIKEKKEAKKAWDKIRDQNIKKIYKQKKSKAKKQLRSQRDVCMKICMLDWKQKKVKRSCTDWLGRDRAGKDVQHVRIIKDENSNVMVTSEAVLKRWKEYFEKLMNKENNRDPRTERAEVVNEEVNCVSSRSEECTEKDEKR